MSRLPRPSDYPTYASYDGGGAILNGDTSVGNVVYECKINNIKTRDVLHLIIKWSSEIIIQDGEIRGTQPYMYHNETKETSK